MMKRPRFYHVFINWDA
ncbi:hypothetical protein OIU79_031269, partial [Salix purpurea]